MEDRSSRPGFFERLGNIILKKNPESQEDILSMLRLAGKDQVLDADTLSLLERALAFTDLEVRDVMITYSQMDVIKMNDTLEQIIEYVTESSHSRFPVIGDDKDDILGILHTKDLLKYFFQHHDFSLEGILREAVFVPESKSLNRLVKEFCEKRIHLAIVVDEYGGVSGLLTLEDIIEQIIGNIEDEFDTDLEQKIIQISGNRYRIDATTEIEQFNHFFSTNFSDEEVDTIGGLVLNEIGHLPDRGDVIEINGCRFQIARVDRRRIHTFIVLKTEQLSSRDE